MCITSGVVLNVQGYQLEKKVTEDNGKKQKKNMRQKMFIGCTSSEWKYKGGKSGGQMKQDTMYILPVAGFTGAPSRYSTILLITKRLAQLDKHYSECIPDTQKEKSSKTKSYNIISNNCRIILSQNKFFINTYVN